MWERMMAHDGLRSACNCCLETLSITVFFDPCYSASQLINTPSAMIKTQEHVRWIHRCSLQLC
jgi:hypothetical protein